VRRDGPTAAVPMGGGPIMEGGKGNDGIDDDDDDDDGNNESCLSEEREKVP